MPSSPERRKRETQCRELTEGPQEASRADITLDALFQLLSDQIRRRILLLLSTGEQNYIAIDELSDELIARGVEMPRRTLSVDLHHAHIPRLADAGLLIVDRESGTVRYRPDTRVETLLKVVSIFEGR
ncbi:ArsR/SmtB family transcription factor [Haladaptatus sp. NG-SE-30]